MSVKQQHSQVLIYASAQCERKQWPGRTILQPRAPRYMYAELCEQAELRSPCIKKSLLGSVKLKPSLTTCAAHNFWAWPGQPGPQTFDSIGQTPHFYWPDPSLLSAQSWPKVGQKSPQSQLKVGPKSAQSPLKVDQKSSKSRPKVRPKSVLVRKHVRVRNIRNVRNVRNMFGHRLFRIFGHRAMSNVQCPTYHVRRTMSNVRCPTYDV